MGYYKNKPKVFVFSGGCHSGKTTTMLKVKAILESEGKKVQILKSSHRPLIKGSIDELRAKPIEYLDFQKKSILDRVALEKDLLDGRPFEGCREIILIDRALADFIFYLTFYTDKSCLTAEQLQDFESICSLANNQAVESYKDLYTHLFEFEPIPIPEGFDLTSTRPAKLKSIQYSEYIFIHILNVYYVSGLSFCSSKRSTINLDCNADESIKRIISTIMRYA